MVEKGWHQFPLTKQNYYPLLRQMRNVTFHTFRMITMAACLNQRQALESSPSHTPHMQSGACLTSYWYESAKDSPLSTPMPPSRTRLQLSLSINHTCRVSWESNLPTINNNQSPNSLQIYKKRNKLNTGSSARKIILIQVKICLRPQGPDKNHKQC